MRKKPLGIALQTSILYAIVGALWIVFSDRLLVSFIPDPKVIGIIASCKGLAFIIITAFLLYLGLKHQLERYEDEINARKQSDEALHASRIELEAALASMSDAVFISNALGQFIEFNNAFATFHKFKNKGECGKNLSDYPEILEVFTPDGQPVPLSQWAVPRALRGETGINVEHSLRRKDTGETWVGSYNFAPIRNKIGEIVGSVVVGRDITEQKRAEETLRDSEEKFRQLAENVQEIFWITSPTMEKLFYISPAFEKIWGRSCQSLYDSPHQWLEAIHPEDKERVAKAATEKIPLGTYDVEYRITRPNGEVRWIHDHGFPVRNAAGEIYRIVGTAEDITEHRKLEEQLRQAQKLEAIGRLAGGVAHDFNNILTIIQGNASLLLRDELQPSEKTECSNQIIRAAQRATGLTRQLLMFSRKQIMQPTNLNLNYVVEQVAKMLKRILGEDISLQTDFASDLPSIHADATMIEQILMNLAVNARDAMPKGGHLTISTGTEMIKSRHNGDTKVGLHVRLNVSDSGCGIPPEILPHIFEPFFTTKEVGKGTGLGLATAYGIVQQHHGWISVESEVNKGTTFSIFLPASDKEPAQKKISLNTSDLPRGDETILLVEDEAQVRLFAGNLLKRCGYTVLEAESGLDALKIWSENKTKIQLLLTDVIMPKDMTGFELGEILLENAPGLKIIYMSGYNPDVVGVGNNFSQSHKCVLAKPFEAHILAQTVRTRLDNHCNTDLCSRKHESNFVNSCNENF